MLKSVHDNLRIQSAFKGGLAPWQIRRLTEMVGEKLASPVKLTGLAQECRLSVSHFARAFKTSFGTSAHQWLVRQRVECAQALLVETVLPLVEIAAQAGFSDQPAFTRRFRQLVGVSPGRWRRENSTRAFGRSDGDTTVVPG